MANFNQVETQPVIMLNVDGKHLNLDFIVATVKEVPSVRGSRSISRAPLLILNAESTAFCTFLAF
jgi:hypothetical protein